MTAFKPDIVFVGNYWPYIYGGSRISRVLPYVLENGYKVHIFTMPLDSNPPETTDVVINQVNYAGDIFSMYRKILKKILGINDIRENIGLKSKVITELNRKNRFLGLVLDKAFLKYKEIFGFPDVEKKWNKDLLAALDKFLKKNQSKDLIVISEYPVTSHIVVSKLKKKYHFKWVADFVDLWSMNHYYPYGIVRKKLDLWYEKKTLSNAHLLATTSEVWVKKLTKLHPGKAAVAIPHGYDNILREQFLEKSPSDGKQQKSKSFSMLYAGRIYPEMQDISIFFGALKRVSFKAREVGFKCSFYSLDRDYLSKSARLYDIEEFVEIREPVARNDLLQFCAEADLLFVIGINSVKGETDIPSKVYDYIVACQPIFSVGGHRGDELNQLIKTANLGTTAIGSDTCAQELINIFSEYKQNGHLSYNVNETVLQNYSQRSVVKKWLTKINGVNIN